MTTGSRVWLAAALLVSASGCDLLVAPRSAPDAVEGAPSPELSERAVRALLPGLRFGADERAHTYREVRAVRVAGSHFVPAGNRYVVHYCVDYASFASDELATRCDLNVQVYALDSGAWVGYATGAGTIYRWQVLETSAPGSAPPSDSAEPHTNAAP